MDTSNKYNSLSPKELHQWMESNKKFHLIDVLPGDRFQKIHLPHSVNVCVFEVTFIDQIKAITGDKNAAIVLCGSSDRSMEAITAAEKLEHAGYNDVHLLTGGIESWCAANLPVEGEAIDTPDDSSSLKLEDQLFEVDTSKSVIEWTGRNAKSTHFGEVKIAAGEIVIKDGAITGTFDIDMNSITNKDLEGNAMQPVLIAHLKSDDFFLTKLFPTAQLKILSAKPVTESCLSAPNFEINGVLELRGVKAELDFMATVTRTAENGLTAEAHFDIDRTKWNIIYGSARFFKYLGKHLVFDLISIQVRITAA
jgi:rhodanese-related sulfurtransferase/polyisoprenoid-binding protein YceI